MSRLRVADNEKQLPTGGTSTRSLRAALDLYLDAAATVRGTRLVVQSRSRVVVPAEGESVVGVDAERLLGCRDAVICVD